MKQIVYTEYGLELLECFIDELSKFEGLKKAADMIRPTHRLLANEINKEKAALLAAESDIVKYNAARGRLEMPLREGKEQIKKILALPKEE